MKIRRRSPRTGRAHTMELDVTEEELAAWQRGARIQDACPRLSDEQREFILTGFTPEDWDALFPDPLNEEG